MRSKIKTKQWKEEKKNFVNKQTSTKTRNERTPELMTKMTRHGNVTAKKERENYGNVFFSSFLRKTNIYSTNTKRKPIIIEFHTFLEANA